MIESTGSIVASVRDDTIYWSLDIDMQWVGDLSIMLEGLSPISPIISHISSLLNNFEVGVRGNEVNKARTIIETDVKDFFSTCTNQISNNETLDSSSDEITPREKLKLDFDLLVAELYQLWNSSMEATVEIFNGNLQQKKGKTETFKHKAFCWPEISRFSGRFLVDLSNLTFLDKPNPNPSHNSNSVDSDISCLTWKKKNV